MKATKEEFESWDEYNDEFEDPIEVIEYDEEVKDYISFLTLTDEHMKALEEGKLLYIEDIELVVRYDK